MMLLAASVGAASPRRLPPARVALRVRGGQVAEAGDPRLHLAGKLFPALRRTVLTSEKCGLALTKVLDAAAFADFAVIASIGLAATPILKFLRAVAHARFPALGPWESSYMSIGARGLRRLAKWMMILYVVDLTCLAATTRAAARTVSESGGFGHFQRRRFGLPIRADLPLIAASLAYPIWLANLCSALKAKALGMREKTSEARHIEAGIDGKTLVYNRLLDFGIFVFAALGALEVLSLELGVAFTSLIAVSGVSSVVVALACQEPLTHLINGLLLTFNDKFQPGEEVKFGDVAGFVTSMGWFDTHVRRYDESTASDARVVSRKNASKPALVAGPDPQREDHGAGADEPVAADLGPVQDGAAHPPRGHAEDGGRRRGDPSRPRGHARGHPAAAAQPLGPLARHRPRRLPGCGRPEAGRPRRRDVVLRPPGAVQRAHRARRRRGGRGLRFADVAPRLTANQITGG